MPRYAAMLALMREAPICVECAAVECGLTSTSVHEYLRVITAAVDVCRLQSVPCALCGRSGVTFSVRLLGAPSDLVSVNREDDLRARARLLVNVHETPTICEGENTQGKPCGLLCGEPIAPSSRWYEIRFATRRFWLDRECFALWQEETRRAKLPGPVA
jgi:hypothetical protein